MTVIENMSQARRTIASAYRGQDVDVYRMGGTVHVRVGANRLPPAEFGGEITDKGLLDFVSKHLGAA